MFEFTAEEIDAIRLSLWVASIGILASLPFGMFIAYALAFVVVATSFTLATLVGWRLLVLLLARLRARS